MMHKATKVAQNLHSVIFPVQLELELLPLVTLSTDWQAGPLAGGAARPSLSLRPETASDGHGGAIRRGPATGRQPWRPCGRAGGRPASD